MYALKREFIKYTDQIGITGSFICLVHCIITSGVMIGSSFLSHSAHHHHDHIHHVHHLDMWGMMDISMIVISGIAVYFSTLKCSAESLQNKLMWASYIVYTICMLSKYAGFEPIWLSGLSYAMSFTLIGLHFRNIKNCNH